jgi:hypothetical protein
MSIMNNEGKGSLGSLMKIGHDNNKSDLKQDKKHRALYRRTGNILLIPHILCECEVVASTSTMLRHLESTFM